MATSDDLQVIVRPVRATDTQAWFVLWHGYCDELSTTVSAAVADSVWQRILAPLEPIGCLLACRAHGEPVGFANYVLHPRTWSLQPACYLEDLFVAQEARGVRAGRALVEGLARLGKQQGWPNLYWHTREDNHAARRLYDRLATRTDYVRYDIKL